MNDKYFTIEGPSEGLYKDKGSRFIAYAYPVRSVQEVRPLVEALEKEHHSARHHCYAYRLFSGEWRANDDGEPSGSAGRQILSQIDSAGLQDVLVVVVRYFGGILLGVPGLIRAYRESAADSLAQAVKVERTATVLRRISFAWPQQPQVEKVLKDFKLEAKNRLYLEECSLEIEIPVSLQAQICEILKKYAIFIDQ